MCPCRRSDAQLTVVSYNILAQKYIDAGYHGDEAWLSWSHRQPRILAELDSYGADVICLQEVLRSCATGAAGASGLRQGREESSVLLQG